MRNNRRQRARSGFTLMEIILVAAILVIIASMATIGFLSMQRGATSKLAMNEIKQMENACTLFKINNLHFPNQLQDLFTRPSGVSQQQWGGPYLQNGDTLDPWGNEFVYSADESNDRVTITSAGPDRQTGTDDDITNAVTNVGN